MVSTVNLIESIVGRLGEEALVRIPASWDEYWTLLEEMEGEPYQIEYINGEINAKMSQASDNHETIVMNIGAILGNAYYDKAEYRVMGSSKIIYVPDCDLATNPDVLVMKGESQLRPRAKKVAGIINPYLLVEIQSSLTEEKDLAFKLPCYKKLDSVQQIVYVDQNKPYISTYTKNQTIHHWFNDDYDTLDMMVKIDDFEISMKDIYHKVVIL